MDTKLAVITLAISFAVITITIPISQASDPDPLQDYCIPIPTNTSNSADSDFLRCKSSSLVTADDFVFTGLWGASPPRDAYSASGFATLAVTAASFPGLNTLGMSVSRVDILPGGSNPPHFHPRATEVAFVVSGQVLSGFVDSNNRVLSKTLRVGDVMVFPKALVHFQSNVGNSVAIVLGHFNSQNPGTQLLSDALLGSGLSDEVLGEALRLSSQQVDDIRRNFLSRKV